MSEVFETLWTLGDKLAAHVVLSAAALALGIAVALPLAVWASRSRTVERIALGFASLVQTIPALALLALFFPILLSLRALFGEGLPALGFLPALLALALYALLPILRNAVTARAEMAPGVLQAADAVGMTGWQKLRLVEAPLAAPFVMAGIRTAAVWTIGAATLSTTVGQPSLGDPIFAGLQTQTWSLVVAGCLASAGLALAADGLLALVERGMKARRPALVWTGTALIAAGLAAALLAGTGRDRDTVVVGAKNFSEQYILARLIGDRLEAAGYAVEYREGLGSAVVHRALTSGQVDVYVDYSGTVWANEMKRDGTPPRAEMLDAIAAWEKGNGARMLGALGFENAYAFAMKQERAGVLGIASLADLAAKGRNLTLGGDLEFFRRPEWRAVDAAYGLGALTRRNFAPTFMYDALGSDEADVITAFSSDGRIAADRLVVLADPRGALPAYDAILLISPGRADDRRFTRALMPLVGAIPVEAMREANFMVDRPESKKTPEQAARWLAERVGS
ncbi:Glycine betaine/carnitine/choline transport system permease protein OpuCB [Tsuneonella dongtanensis]|uniref:Glycine betaine/carnitine/choline transport system permease protein OpuCB n=1 Tax=Tsuneonella dongtanensis TaxID=692370 RepID=A0A1B2AAS0_9SPHN|nr:ABC transporter permease/substrate-binding protein [Tsuneonella dongtanensis]ANY19260.1 Glycine betaine/carnitine/choline transport system permease protein OpuCB [Tsuneonella dongtanensis]